MPPVTRHRAPDMFGRDKCRDCGDDLGTVYADEDRRYCEGCTGEREQEITIVLERRDLRLLHELAVARAVTAEASEEQAQMGMGSPKFRRAAEVLRRALERS